MAHFTLADGQISLVYKARKGCGPKTILISFSGAIVNFADVYISSDLDSLKKSDVIVNNAGNKSLKSGVGLFNQGNGAFETIFPLVIPSVTSDVYARYDAQSGREFIDISVEAF